MSCWRWVVYGAIGCASSEVVGRLFDDSTRLLARRKYSELALQALRFSYVAVCLMPRCELLLSALLCDGHGLVS